MAEQHLPYNFIDTSAPIVKYTIITDVFLQEPLPYVNRMKDLSANEGYIKIDPRDTVNFCAAVNHYNEIYKITAQLYQSRVGAEILTYVADLCSRMKALQALYKPPRSEKDLRIGLIWFKALSLLGDHVTAQSVIQDVYCRTTTYSPWLLALLNRSKCMRENQDTLVARKISVAKRGPRDYSLEEMRKFVLPDASFDEAPILTRLANTSAKCDHARLFRYITVANHIREGRLNQLTKNRKAQEDIIVYGINFTAIRNNHLNDATHVMEVLKQTYDVLIGLMEVYDGVKTDNINPMGPETLLKLHELFLGPARCCLNLIPQRPMFCLRSIPTGFFKLDPTSPPGSTGSDPKYCPPREVRVAITYFLELLEQHISSREKDPFVKAAWAHQFFELINPFCKNTNLFMARIVVTYVHRRCGLLPLLIREEDIKGYRHARYLSHTTSDLSHLARFFSIMQLQALMIIIARDKDKKRPSERHTVYTMHLVEYLEELIKHILSKTKIRRENYSQEHGWEKGVPFKICTENSRQIILYEDHPKAVNFYSRILVCPFRPWHKGNVAVYVQDHLGNNLWLTCVNLTDLKRPEGEIERIKSGCESFLKEMEKEAVELPKAAGVTHTFSPKT